MPKTIPTIEETPKAKNIDQVAIAAGKNWLIIKLVRTASKNPIVPPIKLSATDSDKN